MTLVNVDFYISQLACNTIVLSSPTGLKEFSAIQNHNKQACFFSEYGILSYFRPNRQIVLKQQAKGK